MTSMDIAVIPTNMITFTQYKRLKEQGAFSGRVDLFYVSKFFNVHLALNWVRVNRPNWGIAAEFGIEDEKFRGYWGNLFRDGILYMTEVKQTFDEAEAALLDLCLDELEKKEDIYANG